MLLDARQQDALTELINIAFARTANALSELTGQRVLIGVPQVMVCPSGELAARLHALTTDEVTSVHQVFTGRIAGDALLVLDRQSAMLLYEALTGVHALDHLHIDVSAQEVLTEVGNIMLNACLSMFGDVLQVQLRFMVPVLRLGTLEALIRTLVVGEDKLRHAILVHTSFCLRDSSLKGYLVIVLGVTSLDTLLQGLEAWEQRTLGGDGGRTT